jgi:hypothetical protein
MSDAHLTIYRAMKSNQAIQYARNVACISRNTTGHFLTKLTGATLRGDIESRSLALDQNASFLGRAKITANRA